MTLEEALERLEERGQTALDIAIEHVGDTKEDIHATALIRSVYRLQATVAFGFLTVALAIQEGESPDIRDQGLSLMCSGGHHSACGSNPCQCRCHRLGWGATRDRRDDG